MLNYYAIAFFLVLSTSNAELNASVGDADPLYRNCVSQCEETGCVEEKCFPNCKFSLDEIPNCHSWDMLEPYYKPWKKQECKSDCQYHCMLDIEEERQLLGESPVKYHGKWPFKRIYGIQEPASMAFSALNLAMHFHGWRSFFNLLHKKLPLSAGKKNSYEYAGLWHAYGLLSVNSWFWSVILHTRDFELTEKLDYSSAVGLLGYSLILAIVRSFNIKDEATRVMIFAPLLSFLITHIFYLNFYKFDHEWNMKVCVVIVVAQLTIWVVWAGVNQHPSRWKLWFVVLIGGLAMFLKMYDFPPYEGLLDAHSLWVAITIPLTCLWWSFVRDDAVLLTSKHSKKSKKSK
ncbi:post-GPI attachment to proteins factor 3 [Abrus precatorius]|uniref:Post-GPI attachment to proteins factor 3 n=1 Tax=Abrus precatorius TaxID=3816 RepID=A0A8B8KJP3_ABRPR|nr:post-GPI attachment to proteins factor 3 [Abrus precatorius]